MKQIWILFIFFPLSLFAQTETEQLRFQHLTTEQGLPHNFVHSVTQDKEGFIWIGTNYGLARYDGYNFKLFQPNAQKPFSITHKPVGKLFVDSKNHLWLAIRSGGLNKMDLQTEKFTSYFTDLSKKFTLKAPEFIYEDSDSNIWIANDAGIFLFNSKFNAFIWAFSKKNFKTSENFVTSFTDDNCGNLWFTVEHKIGVLNKKTFKIETIGQTVGNTMFDTMQFNSVLSANKGEIWISTMYNGLICYNSLNNKINFSLTNVKFIANLFIDSNNNLYAITNYPCNTLYVCSHVNLQKKTFQQYLPWGNKTSSHWIRFINDRLGNVWISSSFGITKFNFQTGLTLMQANKFIPNTIADNTIDAFFIDKSDNLWVCPYRKGINKADIRQKLFKQYTPTIENIHDINRDKTITSIHEDKNGNIWLGNPNNNLTLYNKKTGKYSYSTIQNSDAITAIFEDNQEYLWFGSYSIFLHKVKLSDIQFFNNNTEFKFKKVHTYDVMGVRKIATDTMLNLWFAGSHGLFGKRKNTNEFINYSELYDSLNNASSFYRFVFVDKKQNIWTGSNSGGLCKFNPLQNKFKHYLNNSNKLNSISSNTVYAIYEDTNNYIWVGTGQGLEKFNPHTETFEHMGLNKELFKRSIYSLCPDTQYNIWMSCDIGIIKYNILSKQVLYYGNSDGIQNNEFNTTASYMGKNNTIYLGGSEGLISFNPTLIKSNPIFATPIITNFLIRKKVYSPGDSLNGRVLLTKQIWVNNKIELFYNEADFTIEFSALHYSAPDKIKYEYKLDGFNTDWIRVDAKQRYASYTGLPSGKYVFNLRVTNNDGLWNKPNNNVKLEIIIIPPFWKTVWFITIITIVIITLIITFIALRLRNLHNKNKLLDLKVKERTKEIEEANRFLAERTKDLAEANTNLEERQEEIYLQKEEILTQYELLENTNKLLQEQQKKIIEQNIELDKHRNKLEFLVEERTKELEKALQKAEESERLKTSFLTNISHEIRTPMNAIIGFSSLLKDESLSDRRDEFIEMIDSNGSSLMTLINDILELSSMQSQDVVLKPTSVNLQSVLKQLYDTFNLEINKNNTFLVLNSKLINNNLHILCDEVRLKQVLANLLANAIKFTENGLVEFGIKEITTNIVFYVKDSGIGISKDTGNLIFDRFYKVENNSNKLYRGTGLGLAICKSIVDLWKGNIWYESELEKGTTFYFTLPLIH